MLAMTEDDLVVRLTELTGMSPQDIRDVLSLPPDAQAAVVKTYADQSWAQSKDTLGAIISALETAGAVAGAASAIVAFAALL